MVTQREVGVDTPSFEIALKNTLRQAPDVIMIGEIRSRETMDYAVTFAETGHLCLATLHANNANQALDRIINFFPPTDMTRYGWICPLTCGEWLRSSWLRRWMEKVDVRR
jgi:twitching motility protein PilU